MKLLKEQPLWLLWKKQNRNGKVAKVPFSATGGSSGTNDEYSSTWVTYQEAELAAARKNADGVGFKIPNGVFFLDIDHKDLNDPMVKEILDLFNSYTEYSVSGDGIHVYSLCDFSKLPTYVDKAGSLKLSKEYYIHHPSNGLELYVGELTNRFAVYTGDTILDLPLQDCTDAINTILSRYMRKPEKVKPNKEDKRIERVIQDLRNQSKGDKFSRLFDKGEMDGTTDDSKLDAVLCALIASRANEDTALIDAVFRRSALYREKWEREDYRERTISWGIQAAANRNMKPPSPDVLSTIQIPCDWNATPIPTPVFDQYISTLTNGDKEVEELLLQYIGACISNIQGSMIS